MKFKKLNPNAILPCKNLPTDCGFDLYALQDVIIHPGECRKIPTGIAVDIPINYYGRICDRSGFSSKNNAHIIAGQIDHGYVGDLTICMSNLNRDNVVRIKAGDKIAQLVICPIHPDNESEEVKEFEHSERGEKGFGSSDE